ncbi:hypothetical protein DPX39_040068600 [Trypanosoma brucei equiperdum]|uniref:Uncharacterized protein n=1 Tax=Trypanosoma brucei equiperdum TaxID=630700 RepID=A0A3L6L9P7_9TRYP|nr:hypothetical protein DPX39_040068600 [Trypanosoma brucei equiperdum]
MEWNRTCCTGELSIISIQKHPKKVERLDVHEAVKAMSCARKAIENIVGNGIGDFMGEGPTLEPGFRPGRPTLRLLQRFQMALGHPSPSHMGAAFIVYANALDVTRKAADGFILQQNERNKSWQNTVKQPDACKRHKATASERTVPLSLGLAEPTLGSISAIT